MALGTPAMAKDFKVQVGLTSGGTYDDVGHANSFDVDDNEEINEFDCFGISDPVEALGTEKVQITIGGYMSLGDTGQDRIRTQADARAEIWIKVLWDGTNGFIARGRCMQRKKGSRAGNNLNDVNWTFRLVPSTIAVVGTGPTP
jgi:hypothetical protein